MGAEPRSGFWPKAVWRFREISSAETLKKARSEIMLVISSRCYA